MSFNNSLYLIYIIDLCADCKKIGTYSNRHNGLDMGDRPNHFCDRIFLLPPASCYICRRSSQSEALFGLKICLSPATEELKWIYSNLLGS
ncbi:hypothetical protein [Phormidium nigroviride]